MGNKLLNSQDISIALNTLYKMYPKPQCGLNYSTPFELMLSLILAAQCTDERVNVIRPKLAQICPTPQDILRFGAKNVYSIIKSCSFPNNKSRHIVAACEVLIEKFNGEVPKTMQELTTIPGIGRKSANIILNECFNITEGIAVDTHVTRLSKKIGFTNSTHVKVIEKDLMRKIPKDMWKDINHILVMHGKSICTARNPKCDMCELANICRQNKARRA